MIKSKDEEYVLIGRDDLLSGPGLGFTKEDVLCPHIEAEIEVAKLC